MTFTGKQVVVSHTTATQISAPPTTGGAKRVTLKNHDAANPVYLGGDNTVTVGGGANPGFTLKAGEAAGPIILAEGGTIYGLAGTADVTLDVMEELE